MAYIGNKPPVVSNLITDLKIGEDDETKIDFADANTINFHANNSKEMVLVENALTPGTSDGIALGTTSLMWSDLFLASGGVMNFNNGNVTITHTNGTGLTINSTNKLMFGDAASFIQQSSDGVLRIDGEATVDINASTAVTVSNDLKLDSDSAVLGFGADNDTTLTHTDGTGLTLNSTNKLTFGDAATFIHQSGDGVMTIDGEATIDLNASTAVLVSNDLKLNSDSAVLGFGADNDATITHADDAGLTFNSTSTFQDVVLADDKTITLADEGQLILGDVAPSQDHKGTGVVVKMTATDGVGLMEAVYINGSGKLDEADADAVGTMPAIGVALEANASGSDAVIKVLIQGVLRDDTFDFTPGADLFIGTSDNAGLITETAPSGSGDTVQKVGVALTADTAFLNFNTTEVLLA